jgi:hypothetical protein
MVLGGNSSTGIASTTGYSATFLIAVISCLPQAASCVLRCLFVGG